MFSILLLDNNFIPIINMSDSKPIGFKSTTGWEKSHYGGFTRILNDYPFISVPMDFTIRPASSVDAGGLAQWEASKLLKMFMLCAMDMKGGLEAIFVGATQKPVMKQKFVGGEFRDVPMIELTTTKECMINALKFVLASQGELAPLFAHYTDLVHGSEFELLVEPEKKEGEGDGEGELGGELGGEGESSGDGDGEPGEAKEGDGKESDAPPTKKEEAKSTKEAGGAGKEMTAADVQELKEQIEQALKDVKKHSTFKGGYGSAGAGSGVGKYKEKAKFLTVKVGKVPTKMSQDQIKNAEILLKMLDITFESEKDIVKSLKMGKIDLAKIAEVPAGNTSIYQREMEEQTTKPFSICILMDESGSMGGYYDNDKQNADRTTRYTQQHRLVKSLYHAFSQLLPEDKMFIYGHSGEDSPEIYTYHDIYNPNFLKTIDDQKKRDTIENYDGPVIEAIHGKIREITEDRIIFLVLSDGSPCGYGYGGSDDILDLKRIVEKARRDEFVTVGIGIQYGGVDLYTYSTTVNNLEEMPKKVSHVLNKVVKTEFQ